MPTAMTENYRVAEHLLEVQEASTSIRDLKSRTVQGLSVTRTWGRIVGSVLAEETLDPRPPSMLRRVDFDDSLDTRGRVVTFAEAPDDECDISW